MNDIGSRRSSTVWQQVLATLGVCLVGLVGGAISGFVITGMPTPQSVEGKSLVEVLNAVVNEGETGASFGAPFGLVVFPICYLTICRRVPLLRIALWGVPATIVSELLYLSLIPPFVNPSTGIPIDFFWVEIYLGGFVGLLIACILLRLIDDRKRRRIAATSSTSS